MDFNTDQENIYYIDKFNKKYYQIVEAKQYGVGLVDIKVRECERQFDHRDVRPKDNFINKELIEEDVYKLVPFGKKKKYDKCLRLFELQNNYVYCEMKKK